MKKISILLILAFIIAACSSQPVQKPLATQTTAFVENFDTWNQSVWKLGFPWGTTDNNMGKAYAANVQVVDGVVCLKAVATNNIGSITSVQQFGYGTYSARMKFSGLAMGAWGGVWMLNDPAGWEIDIAELLGNNPNRFYSTLHYGGSQVRQNLYTHPTSLDGQWHDYTWTWTATTVSFSVDGVQHTSFTYSKPNNTNMIFTMGAMQSSINWDGNHVDSTTFLNTPTLCIDTFTYSPNVVVPTVTRTPITSVPTLTPTKVPTSTPTRTPTRTSTPRPTVAPTIDQRCDPKYLPSICIYRIP